MTAIRRLDSRAAGASLLVIAAATLLGAQTRPPAAGVPAAPPKTSGRFGAQGDVSLLREVFVYTPAGRRDPFVSLAQTEDLRPLFTDLKLAGILADPGGRRSVAVLRDITDAKKQYRVTVGSTLGRLRVTRITSSAVTFTIEEFGRNREEVLSYAADSLRKRTP